MQLALYIALLIVIAYYVSQIEPAIKPEIASVIRKVGVPVVTFIPVALALLFIDSNSTHLLCDEAAKIV